MLFYEPLFLTIFPAVYAFYLLASAASAKKWTLLVVSTLFYLWGEPVFVLVLLVSTAFDYALSFHLNKPTPERMRRLALAAGIAGNLGILVVYKYADFLIDTSEGFDNAREQVARVFVQLRKDPAPSSAH